MNLPKPMSISQTTNEPNKIEIGTVDDPSNQIKTTNIQDGSINETENSITENNMNYDFLTNQENKMIFGILDVLQENNKEIIQKTKNATTNGNTTDSDTHEEDITQ